MTTETKTRDARQVAAEETLNDFVEKMRTEGPQGRLIQLVLEAILYWESDDCAKIEGQSCAEYVGSAVEEVRT